MSARPRIRLRMPFAQLLLLAAFVQPLAAQAGGDVVRRALERTGGADFLEQVEELALYASGWMDKSAERQGWSMEEASPGTYVERLAVAGGGARVAFDYREDRYDGTWEELREIYAEPDRRLIVVLSAGFAVDLRSDEHRAARLKLLRRLPPLLLSEVLERPGRLEPFDGAGDTLAVAGTLSDGTEVRLHFSGRDTLLRRVAYDMDYLSFGDTEVSWRFGDYRSVEGVGLLPHAYGVSIGGRPFTRMDVFRVAAGAGAASSLLRVPEGVRVGEPQQVGPAADASAGARVDTVAPGVYRVVGLRGGFHPMFVDMGDGLVAVDAPAGYPLPNELPAGEVAPGPASDWLSRRYLELMAEAVPGKPVTHVILTHFHNDHGGGLRAFVGEGATVVAPAVDTAEVRGYMRAPHTLAPDALSESPRPLRMVGVEEDWTLEAAGRSLEVVNVGPNPHTAGMLVVRLPDEGILFVSDLLDPTVDPVRFPKPEHAVLDVWFGRWLEGQGLAPDRVYTMHGSGLVTREHLARLSEGEPRGPGLEWKVRDRPVEAAATRPLVEPRVAVDPEDPDHLVVGTIVVDGDRDPWHCAALSTFDGGTSWHRTDFTGLDRCIDPWTLVLDGGEAVATGVQIRRDAEVPRRFRLLMYRSTDGGRSWTHAPDTLGPGFDHPVMVAGRQGELLLASRRNALGPEGRVRHRLSVGRVDARGGGYSEDSSLLPAVTSLAVAGLAPLSDGTLVVAWQDNQREVDGFMGEGMLARARGWAARSADGGRSFGPPFVIGDHCASGGPEAAFPGYPYMEVDRSDGPWGNRLYFACVRPGLEGVAVSRSLDGGRRWSSPVRVDAGTSHARTPMLAVNTDGVVAVAWYDRRLDPLERCQDLYVAVSVDGGQRFGRPVRVSTETSCPDVPGNEGVAGSWPMGGDYSSLAAGPDGDFHVVWADSRGGRFGLRQARFRVEEGVDGG